MLKVLLTVTVTVDDIHGLTQTLESSSFDSEHETIGVSGGIYYQGIYMVKVILTEIYMLEYFL